jgi:TrmH family RNA methyltransferase
LKKFRKLQQKKYRQLTNTFIIEGKKVVEEAIMSDWGIEAALITQEFIKNNANDKIIKDLKTSGALCFEISQKELDSISDTETTQGIAAIIKIKVFDMSEINALGKHKATIVILDRVTDPGNLGTIIRTCDWFGVDAVVISQNSIDLYNPKVVRSTMGALFHIPVISEVELENMIDELKGQKFEIVITMLEGEPVQSYIFPPKVAFVFGSEAHGISNTLQARANIKLTIPKRGLIDSLNVAVACGITLAYRSFSIKY